MKAAALAARDGKPPPPQLWKYLIARQPSWSEFDTLNYREYMTAIILNNVYQVVQAWKSGRADDAAKKQYGQLVKDGIIGIGVK